jgi:hypothetical protein
MPNTRSTSRQHPASDTTAGQPATTAEPEVLAPAGGEGSAPAPAAQPAAGRGTTLRLPFVTATFTRVPVRPAAGESTAPAGGSRPDEQRQRLAFYAGAAALGALEVVEWPVALLVAAGTYLAGRRTPTGPASRPVAGAAGDGSRTGR